VAATLPIADAARSRVGKSRSSSASPAAAATAKDAVASAVVPGSEAMADAEMASQTFVRRRGCPGWCRERKRAAVLFWVLGAILRVWYRGEPFCLFLCFVVCLSIGIAGDRLHFIHLSSFNPQFSYIRRSRPGDSEGLCSGRIAYVAKEVLCEPRLLLCFGSDESHRVLLDDSAVSRQLN
jgi:hypothetical protein